MGIFVIRRLVDHGCSECGTPQIDLLFYVTSKETAEQFVASANVEVEASQVVFGNQYHKNDGENFIHEENWEEKIRECLQLDKDYFEKEGFSSVKYVEYDFKEVEIRA